MWKIAHVSVYLVSHLCSKYQSSNSEFENLIGNNVLKVDKIKFLRYRPKREIIVTEKDGG